MPINEIEYITIASTGNGTDFGDLTQTRREDGACCSTTRGLSAGGMTTNTTTSSQWTIDYITIASTGNATDFGDLTQYRSDCAGTSNSTRGVFGCGLYSSTRYNILDYVTIASTGNATDFGDATSARDAMSTFGNKTRGVYSGHNGGSPMVIDYITIATTGNATDFGDLNYDVHQRGGTSDVHGGLA